MSTTIVETAPVFVCRLRSDAEGSSDSYINRKLSKGGGCSSCPEGGACKSSPSSLQQGGKSSPPTLQQGGCQSQSAVAHSTGSLPTYGATAASPAYCGNKLNVDPHDKFCNFILKVREPVADYLEKHGLPKNSQCTFVSLVTSLVQRSYNAAVTIFMMLYNLLPLMDGFVYILRFILDKMIEICYTTDRTEKILKGVLFLGELIVLFIIVMTIVGLILMPVWCLVGYVLNKFFGFPK